MIKQFNIGCTTYEVKEVDILDDGYTLGIGSSIEKTIYLANTCYKKPTNEQTKELTLYHEVVHVILDELGYNELSNDEKFVNSFSLLLHQFEKSKK